MLYQAASERPLALLIKSRVFSFNKTYDPTSSLESFCLSFSVCTHTHTHASWLVDNTLTKVLSKWILLPNLLKGGSSSLLTQLNLQSLGKYTSRHAYECPGKFNWRRKADQNVCSIMGWAGVPDWMKREKSEIYIRLVSIPFKFLTVDAMWPTAFTPSLKSWSKTNSLFHKLFHVMICWQ